ncbi:hypothetical protein ACFX15_011929 [Malus domestica]
MKELELLLFVRLLVVHGVFMPLLHPQCP